MKILIVLGSTRKSLPPKPPRLAARVSEALRAHLEADYPDDDIELIDPLDYDLGKALDPHTLIGDFTRDPKQRNAPD